MLVWDHLTREHKRRLCRLYTRSVPSILIHLCALVYLTGSVEDGAGIDGAEFFAGLQAAAQHSFNYSYSLQCLILFVCLSVVRCIFFLAQDNQWAQEEINTLVVACSYDSEGHQWTAKPWLGCDIVRAEP